VLLNLLCTHLNGPTVDRQLAYLRALAPEARFVVCHSGRHEEFEAIAHPDKLFIDDDSLRTSIARDQSPVEMLRQVHQLCRADPEIDAIFLMEYDQLLLRGDFESALRQLSELSGADLLGKTCVLKDSSNWIHSIRARRDPEFMAFLRRITVREGPPRLYGCLGTGFLMRREALEALVAVEPPRLVYHEMYIPTVLHHLGYRLGDFDEISDIYEEVAYRPAKTLAEVLDAKCRGHFFVHPFKDVELLDQVRRAPGPVVGRSRPRSETHDPPVRRLGATTPAAPGTIRRRSTSSR
jgi:hypothetical protein